ncbi:DUF6392 family protein [Pseudomonas gingeri]|uniref:Pyocin immunity protein n=1 Tax=Pseudomonas gingeri TaxID=117681 RepID=A0A7Y7YB01_9PSED|nr:DUF6392 family protein [Pseudomonas gingeri]NWA04145.1 pyocin immunity protein [Pseudomonas gingeri]NWA17491.1 pyocin immunity protein [Pseudomonas gingeri]NWA56452.1 pyocin immunity protein [Pseudomonas gingeri]NWA97762.1 pyocin immunity protein [Pseudomonas gingeri]NWB05397.1 pyocin immunity protein [Pseudomonas gingeri]
MDAMSVSRLVKGLGFTYNELVTNGVTSNKPLKPSMEGNDNEYLIQQPEAGLELWFRAESQTLEKILFSLIKILDGTSVYTGELPSPFAHNMDRSSVRVVLGEPFESKDPIKILQSKGFGGGDVYLLDCSIHPNARIGFQYRKDNMVCTMGFSLNVQ